MIVAEKELKIEGGYAPDLNMKMGEVNRQYILIPPFDISTYSVRSEIVKPDNTFVYTDQAINTDGNILLTLPEQAGAVAGYGHYIIKIYDLNTIVYSAVGVLRIDDHLILDGMIESVAEVNGYRFPDDFVIRGELGNIFDDSTVSNETGWTSSKISQEIGSAAVVFDDTQISNSLGWTSSKINNELLGMFDNNTTSNTKGWTSSKIDSEIAGVLDDTTTSSTTGWSSSKIDSEISGVLDDNTTSSTTGWSSDKITTEINTHTPTVSKTASGNPIELTDAADAPMVRCTTEIQGYQEGTGTPSPDNIRPIVAYSQGEIVVRGKNLIDGSDIKNWTISSTGVISSNNSYYCFVATVKSGNVYTYSQNTQGSIVYAFYENLPDIGSQSFNSIREVISPGNVATFTAPGNYYVVIRSDYTDDNNQLETGGTVTPYSPYASTTYTTTFPSTIYRGREDVANEEVTTQKKKIVFDGSEDEDWQTEIAQAGRNFYINIPDAKYQYLSDEMCSNMFPVTEVGATVRDKIWISPGKNLNVTCGDTLGISTVADLKTWLSTHNLEVAYTLATTTTSSVTVSNSPIRTLSGYNRIESSTGDLEVEYITQTYEPIIKALEH